MIAMHEGQLDDAYQHLKVTEEIFRRGRFVAELPKTLLCKAELKRLHHDWDEAKTAIEEALRWAAPRQMRLVHADALVLRAHICVDQTRAESSGAAALRAAAERAEDDLEAALTIARDCGYAWAERDALSLLAETSDVLGFAERAVVFRREADILSRRLADTTPPPPGTFDFAAEEAPKPRRRRGRASRPRK